MTHWKLILVAALLALVGCDPVEPRSRIAAEFDLPPTQDITGHTPLVVSTGVWKIRLPITIRYRVQIVGDEVSTKLLLDEEDREQLITELQKIDKKVELLDTMDAADITPDPAKAERADNR